MERWEIEELVFDKRTLMTLAKIMNKGIFKSLDYMVSMGKEANVYRATTDEGFLAVKIYKVETTRFVKRDLYLDKKVKRNMWYVVKEFANKEYKNLLFLEKISVPAPKAVMLLNNVVVMEYLGDDYPFPRLHDRYVEGSANTLLKYIERMAEHGFVHGDLSEYNVLVGKNDELYVIDVSQAVRKHNPNWKLLLERDIDNIVKFGEKHGEDVVDKAERLKEKFLTS